ncbi:MAG: MBL fold metallo-hydrolase [Bradyrhizobium sp.]|jgi:glyoxylase-like metal-dependent hydrolase (beta-lactamase superfamily II)|uniref:MBL fold metallo-hydrolase n=1 Tax=Bradyrhizobium sp. TaxID=376 RepID=UPI0011FF90A4|nr:MBL fold metallo-hydrolase [Bradyrhizobium sp.]THD57181.1 MAG: MBL fold metallo-hydrolase [Bradyrhizobium sp.]
MQRSAVIAFCFGLLALPAAGFAQQPENIVLNDKDVKQLTPHVWAIYGNPNIGIVVGSKGTLVVDTGLGKRNGTTVDAVMEKLRKGKLYLATTHFHPEHVTGQSGFPADTVVIRNIAQQKELEESGAGMIDFFRSRSDVNKELLVDAGIDKADILFDNEMTLDLGDVTVRMVYFGPAHTNGDIVFFVEPEKVMISGDIVQNKFTILPIGTKTTIKGWISVLDRAAELKPALILPDHSPPGDSAMFAEQRAYMVDLLAQTQAAKSQGKSVEDAVKVVTAELQTKYPGWLRPGNATRAITMAYKEAP